MAVFVAIACLTASVTALLGEQARPASSVQLGAAAELRASEQPVRQDNDAADDAIRTQYPPRQWRIPMLLGVVAAGAVLWQRSASRGVSRQPAS